MSIPPSPNPHHFPNDLPIPLLRSTPGAMEVCLDVNRAMVELFGYADEAEFMAQGMAKLFANAADRLRLSNQICNEGYVQGFEACLRRKDGTCFLGRITARAGRDATGAVDSFAGMVEDITEARRVEQSLAQRDAILEAISAIATDLLRCADWESVIDGILQRLGEASGASRVYTFEHDVDQAAAPRGTQRHEWVAPGIAPQIDNPDLQDMDPQHEGFRRLGEILARGEIYNGFISDLPAEEQAILSDQGILSIVLVPIFIESDWWGFIGFDECRSEVTWSVAQVEALKSVGALLGAFLLRRRIERTLRESEERYRRLFETESDSIIIVDGETQRIIDVNEAATELYGYLREEWLSFHCENISAEPAETRQATQIATQQKHHQVPLRWHRKKDGTVFPVEIALGSYLLNGRRLICSVHRDITERRRAEDALRQSLAEIRQIFDLSPTVIWKYSPREDRFLYVSKLITELGGMDRDEFLQDHHPWNQGVDKGEESQRALKIAGEAIQNGQPYQVEYLIHTPHKGPRWLQVMGRPSREGDELYYYGNTVDVTDLKQAEQERKRLATAVIQSAEAVILINLDGEIEYVNPACLKITGYALDEVIGKPLSLIRSDKHDEAYFRGIWETVTAGNVWRGRMISRKKSGEHYEHLETFAPVRDERDVICNYALVQLDMSKEMRLERELQQAERLAAIGQTITGIAHYLKNICGILRCSAVAVQRALANDDTATIASMWGIFTRNAERIAELAEQMLAYSKGQDLTLMPIDINLLVGEVRRDCQAQADQRNIAIEFIPEPALPLVCCDHLRMTDVIMNLVSNAIDACCDQEGGLIQIGTAHDTETRQIRVTVRDNGPGIPQEIRAKIFDPFFTTKSKGTGLGLAMTEKTIREHGGRITLESQAGATEFAIDLPAM